MPKYYYIKDGEKIGPFSLKELKDKDIKKSTLVWKEGLDNWLKARKLEEVNELITTDPPKVISQHLKQILFDHEYVNIEIIHFFQSILNF